MTSRFAAAIAASFLTIGALLGAAGAVVVRDAATPRVEDHMAQMAGMMSMMNGGSMMGSAGSMMGSSGSLSPEDHAGHHPAQTAEPTR